MPEEQQGQQYDTSQLDTVEHPTLGTLKFPKAMPPEERNASIDRMLQAKPAQTEAPPKKSLWQKVKDVAGTVQHYTDPLSLAGDVLGGTAEVAERKREEAQTENLTQAARGAAPTRSPGWYDLAARTARMGAGMTTPKSRALAATAAVAPGAAALYMVPEGAWNAFKNAPEALRGNPEAAEASLSGAAEVAGGAALGGESLRAGVPAKAYAATKRIVGRQMSPEAAETPRPAGTVQPALASPPREVLEHAAQEGIQLTPAQATEAPVARSLQAAGERGLLSGKGLNEALEANRAKFGEAVNKFSERVDPTRLGMSEEATGEAIRQSTETAKSVAHENATNGYKKIDYLMKEKVDPSPISKKWMDLRESLPMGVEEQIRAQVPRNLSAAVEDMLSARPQGFRPTVEQAIKLRSFFREMGESEGLPNSHQAAFRQLSQVADSAIETTANKIGATEDWRAANQGWKDYTVKYGDKQSLLYRILKQRDPAKITRDLMTRASAADVETLRNEGMTSALEPLRRQVIQDIARNKFTVGRDGLGGYSNSFLRTLFGPGMVKELYLKADIARRINWEVNPSGTSNVLLATDQLGKPSRIAELFGAAKMSMPRSALNYLPKGKTAPFGNMRGMLNAAIASSTGDQR